ncbi:hypothetical protein [Loktanella sp. SALINAS62]|uniref:hypothetical protein n=1 Tax=Loktanella sp. SALINAS62 TaxID=2706124 RepID=UPI001B8BFCAA|nr:hypothetical protein [Loktanella sp. SALINAS62]MBS1301931.1 hypothetical protein [Loktanella sp. SALINAS62]
MNSTTLAAACAALTTFTMPAVAQTIDTGAGNPTLTCTQFLELDADAQIDAVANLSTVGSDTMPPPDAGVDSGAVGSMTSSDDAASPDDTATATENAEPGADNMGTEAEVSDAMVRAMVNICRNSAEPA